VENASRIFVLVPGLLGKSCWLSRRVSLVLLRLVWGHSLTLGKTISLWDFPLKLLKVWLSALTGAYVS